VGGGERDLAPELVAGLRLALADALHLRRVQRVELVAAAVLASLSQQPGDKTERPSKGGPHGSLAGDLAADVAEQPAEPSAQLPDLPFRLARAARVDQLRGLAAGPSGHPQVGLAQPDP